MRKQECSTAKRLELVFEPFDFISLGLELVVLVVLIGIVEYGRRRPALGRRLGIVT